MDTTANPSPPPIHVAVAGSYGFMDIGDEAMLTEDLDYMHRVLGIPREQIYLYGAQPHYVAQYHRHPAANCLSSELLVESYQQVHQPPTPCAQPPQTTEGCRPRYHTGSQIHPAGRAQSVPRGTDHWRRHH